MDIALSFVQIALNSGNHGRFMISTTLVSFIKFGAFCCSLVTTILVHNFLLIVINNGM
ncbi:hypothetical protein GALL_540280 [mine drainage metagenome]|uniref:Uncharacterized protein n=1 Tax=mine drainage metagenome TaxID=410659 RepID=A0A1J5PLK9_9ZZZZ